MTAAAYRRCVGELLARATAVVARMRVTEDDPASDELMQPLSEPDEVVLKATRPELAEALNEHGLVERQIAATAQGGGADILARVEGWARHLAAWLGPDRALVGLIRVYASLPSLISSTGCRPRCGKSSRRHPRPASSPTASACPPSSATRRGSTYQAEGDALPARRCSPSVWKRPTDRKDMTLGVPLSPVRSPILLSWSLIFSDDRPGGDTMGKARRPYGQRGRVAARV